jgi:uncharacterized protein
MPRLLTCLAACFILLCGSTAHAKLPPRPQGPVYDGASVIPDAIEAQIDARLRVLSKDTGKTLVVATVPSLDGEEIDEYALRLFETWGVGDKEKDEGALILVAPSERRTRIEVGFGSEAVLPDALAGRIIDQQMIPNFKAGNYGEGILQAANAIEEQLRREPADAKAIAAAAQRAQKSGDEGIPFGAIIFMLFIIFFVVLPIIRSLSGGGKKHRRHGYGGPVIIWGGNDWGGGSGGSSWGGGGSSFGGGGFGGFGGGMSGGGGASGGW